ncbi:hypothetical protein BE20_20195 [Sorangium cellulosum]|nr:hypothetical protein BE20_20195 [Sorangium cellulosum]
MARRTEELRAANQRLERELELNRAAELKVRKAQEELAHLNRVSAMSELAASIAHELNQPLPPRREGHRADARDAPQGRAQRGRAGPQRARPRGGPAPGQRGAPRGRDPADRARAGPAARPGIQLQQVLLNLLVNALDAVSRRPPEARLVVVRARRADGGGVELSVADSGEGVPPADLERIFEPFFTRRPRGSASASPSAARSSRRTGPGQGATFRCTLPVWREGEGAP